MFGYQVLDGNTKTYRAIFYRTLGVEIDERDRKDYFSPSTDLFAEYCTSIIDRYGLNEPSQILKQEVTDITHGYLPDNLDIAVPNYKVFTLTTSTGHKFYSRAVVLAMGVGGAGIQKIFPWRPSSEAEGGDACCHSMEIKIFPSQNVQSKIQQKRETNVVVVGGGLSSAQIVDMAVRKGVTKVWFLMRSEFKGWCTACSNTAYLRLALTGKIVKHFDLSLPWMGKYKNWEKAAFWSADTDEGEPHAVLDKKGPIRIL